MSSEHQPNPRATLGAVLLVAVLLVLGIWTFIRLDATQKAQSCLDSGGRRCAVIDADKPR